jgi:ribosomal protein S18 acetylase RimI-like enzyme
MRELERRLKNLGCPKLNLQILNHNMGVVAFYESLGYKVEERVSMGKRFIGGEPESSK